SGVGDPHVDTIDSGRYTCHVQGWYVFAQTTSGARARAESNAEGNVFDMNLIYPDDLFRIHVQSVMVAPALSYIERTHGYGSVFRSYVIISGNSSFTISNEKGKFGCVVNNQLVLTTDLANDLNYDFTGNASGTDQYNYRIKQSPKAVGNETVPQLTVSLWSGLTAQCDILSENLDCVLILPEKFRTFIEGLAGNFNGDPSDDLMNRQTNQTVSISSSSNPESLTNDTDILNACRSWKVSDDATSDDKRPLMPQDFVAWYNNSPSEFLTTLSSAMSKNLVDQTCSGKFECIHDYLIRVNSFTSKGSTSTLESTQSFRLEMAETVPFVDIISPVTITLPADQSNRNFTLTININATKLVDVSVSVYTNGSIYNTPFVDSTVTLLIPNNTLEFVHAL
ncbi:unnamed protein product, partial [Adineta ricciae]